MTLSGERGEIFRVVLMSQRLRAVDEAHSGFRQPQGQLKVLIAVDRERFVEEAAVSDNLHLPTKGRAQRAEKR